MIDIFCPHCGFELTEAEVRRWIASLNGRRPKKRAILSEATFEGEPLAPEYAVIVKTPPQEPIRDRAPVRHLAGMLCKHQRPKHLCLACERGRK